MTDFVHKPEAFDPTELLDDLTAYEPFDWKRVPDMLVPGSVVRVEPRAQDHLFIFESTGFQGRQSAAGYMTKFYHHEDVVETEDVMPAVINLQHPSQYLAELLTPYLEFVIKQGDLTTTIIPSSSVVTRAYSPSLARRVFEQDAYRARVASLQSPAAQAAIRETAIYLNEAAAALEEPGLAHARELILRNLLKND